MTRRQEPPQCAGTVKEQRTALFPPEQLLPAAALTAFGRVCLEERTPCCLHEKWAEALQGAGGPASRSTVKIDVIDELLAPQLPALTVTAGRAADQGHAATIVACLRAGELVMRD
jgi:hypothetical protein